MKDYLHGTALLVGPADFLGDITDTVTDYDYGEKQVFQMRAFYDAVGRPVEFKAAVDAVNTAYENAKAWEPLWTDKLLRWKNATAMKQVGADASQIMAEIQQAYRARAASVPSSAKSAVYDPDAPGWAGPAKSIMKYIPWIVGAGIVIGTGILIAPIATQIIASMRRRF